MWRERERDGDKGLFFAVAHSGPFLEQKKSARPERVIFAYVNHPIPKQVTFNSKSEPCIPYSFISI